MLPEGWKIEPLSVIVKEKISYGIVQAGPHVPDGIPYIKSSDVRGKINLASLQCTSHEIHHKYRRSSVHPGDIVFSLRGNIGQLAIVPDEIEEANLTQGTARIAVTNAHSNLFHYYQLASSSILNRINALSKGSTFKEISLEELRKVRVLCPEFSEQKKIAQILSTWDNAISATERLLENSQQRKKALMQQLLTGKKRLPGFEGEWESKPIYKTGKIVSGGTPDTSKSDLWGGNVQWLTPTDITALKTNFIYDTPRKITQKGVKESSATLLSAGSLCVCTRASVGLMAISTTEITTNQGFKSVVPNNQHDVIFLYYLFSFNRHLFVKYSSGSTFLELSKKDFEKMVFCYPSLDEQVAIARVLTTADQEIEALQKRLGHLEQEKKALMQQLLTGKRRVQVENAA